MTQENKTNEIEQKNTEALMADIKEMIEAHEIKVTEQFLRHIAGIVRIHISRTVSDGFGNGADVMKAIIYSSIYPNSEVGQ